MHREITSRGVSTVIQNFKGDKHYLIVKDQGITDLGYGHVFVTEIEVTGAATHPQTMFIHLSHDHDAMVGFLYEKFKCSKETIERIIFAIRQV